jgi:hypothetical protein
MLSALLAKWSDTNRPRRTPLAETSGRLDGIALFEAIVGEVHLTALQVAAVASAFNALATGVPSGRARSFLTFIPHKPAAIAGLRQCREELGLSHDAASCVDLLYRQLEMARPPIYRFIADLDRHDAPRAIDGHAKTLAATWRRLSQVALDAVDAMEPETRRRLTGLYSENTLILARLLRAAIDGKQPCLDARGEIFLPQLPQRRSARRFGLLQNCTIHYRGARFQAFARDVSAAGLGLDHAAGLMLKQVIEVELKDGRTLAGTVAWAKHGRAGIEFLTALAPNDPLIAG